MRHLVKDAGLDWEVDSCGTHAYHIGEPPDTRTIKVAREFGIDLSPLRARIIEPNDFHKFDWIYAMDQSHYRRLQTMVPHQERHKVVLFLDHYSGQEREVPDPYYEGRQAFYDVFHLVHQACQELLDNLKNKYS